MKSFKTAGIILLAVTLCAGFVFLFLYSDEIIYFYHFHKGNYSDAQKLAMEETRSGQPANYVAERDGEKYILPLPDGAAEYPGGGYLVINYEFWDKYYNEIQTLDGYDFDQMGAVLILTSNDGKIKFNIYIENVARRYELLHVEHTWDPQ